MFAKEQPTEMLVKLIGIGAHYMHKVPASYTVTETGSTMPDTAVSPTKLWLSLK